MFKCGWLSAVPFLLLLFAAATIPAAARNPETGFIDRSVDLNGETYRYQVFLPANWSTSQKWPIILFLHGYGERGDNGLAQTDVGIGHAIRLSEKPLPFVVVLPQCRAGDHVWNEPDMEAVAFAELDQSMREFHGDPDRTYLTGISGGGYGTWNIAARHPHRFAAYVPICGGIRPNSTYPKLKSSLSDNHKIADPYAETARRIGSTPVWIFHGDADPVVPVEESRKMAEALRDAGGNVKYTEYPGVGHNSWDMAYAEPDLLPWLLQQKLRH